jgi:hypothetical protein
MVPIRSEEFLVGLIALGVVPWIFVTVRRGLRGGRLPIGRGYVLRDERPGVFDGLLAFYGIAALLMAAIGLDLIFNLGIGFAS